MTTKKNKEQRNDYKYENQNAIITKENQLNMKKILLFFLVVEALFLQDQFVCGRCFLSHKHYVSVVNNLPNPIRYHCASKDDDFGYKTLNVDQSFRWSFCPNFFPNTLYFCHLWWGQKDQAFEVYNELKFDKKTTDFRWIAKTDGIYLSNQTRTPQKMYNWNP